MKTLNTLDKETEVEWYLNKYAMKMVGTSLETTIEWAMGTEMSIKRRSMLITALVKKYFMK